MKEEKVGIEVELYRKTRTQRKRPNSCIVVPTKVDKNTS